MKRCSVCGTNYKYTKGCPECTVLPPSHPMKQCPKCKASKVTNSRPTPVHMPKIFPPPSEETIIQYARDVISCTPVKEHDSVNKPSHYQLFPDGTQVIDVIRKSLSEEEYKGYLKGNILKYRLRAGNKGDSSECIAKADWYSEELAGL